MIWKSFEGKQENSVTRTLDCEPTDSEKEQPYDTEFSRCLYHQELQILSTLKIHSEITFQCQD